MFALSKIVSKHLRSFIASQMVGHPNERATKDDKDLTEILWEV
jgi:hypothetical protein